MSGPSPRWLGGAAEEMTPDELARLEASWPSCDYWALDRDTERLTHTTVQLDEHHRALEVTP